MKIKKIDIKNIGGIKDLQIEFDERMNFICGPNGIGKTTVLECIAHSFSSYRTSILKRSSLSVLGQFKSVVEVDEKTLEANVEVSDFDPDSNSNINGLRQHSDKLLSLKVTRTFQYKPLNAVSKDIDKNSSTSPQEAKTGVDISEVKNWFVNRYLYSAHKDALTEEQIHNLEIAKKSFSLLNPEFKFKAVRASSNEIMIDSPSGEIYYEYLSSGFKSCLSIVFGIIKDIELRFKSPSVKADEFDGIVLIDELDLHLHPEWQEKISSILIKVFPKVQFITSTHSPHVLQNAQPNEIIALAFGEEGIYQRELNGGPYGFQGWTVEEILTDVMGMSDTRTATYHNLMSEFESAIDSDDYNMSLQSYDKLKSLLHPENHLLKLLKFQLAAVRGNS